MGVLLGILSKNVNNKENYTTWNYSISYILISRYKILKAPMGSKMSTLGNIGTYVIIALISLGIGFVTAWGIVASWVLYWDFGREWNALTVPPLVTWDIYFANLDTILIFGGIIAFILFALITIYVAYN